MNKISYYSFLFIFVAVFIVAAFFAGFPQLLVQVPGKYLAADLGAADLTGIASQNSVLFWTVLIILIILGIGYSIYYPISKRKKQVF